MAVVAESIDLFLDWAIGIVTILIIYYLIKLVIKGVGKEDKVGLEERRKEVKEFITEKGKKIKEKKGKVERKKKLDPVKGFLVNCINAAEEGAAHSGAGTKKEAEEARKKVKEFNRNIRIAWRELRKLRNEAEGEEKAELEKLAVSAHQLVIAIREKTLRESDINRWLRNSREIISRLNGFKRLCGEMITRLDDLMK